MKKIISTLCILTMMISFYSCGKTTEKSSTANESTTSASNTSSETTTESDNTSQSDQPETTKSNEKVISASNIIKYFDDNDAPNLGEYIERTESDDKLLGRPEQYTSKVSFKITTIEFNEDEPYDGCIEVFNNNDDAHKRYNEVSSIIEQYPMFKEYIYLKENVFLRMKYDVLPSDEKIYEQLLDAYMEN